MISLTNHHSQWGRSEVVIIYPYIYVVNNKVHDTVYDGSPWVFRQAMGAVDTKAVSSSKNMSRRYINDFL